MIHGATIYTVGHGNRMVEELVGLLQDAGIECLVDVRAYPASRRNPQFTREALDRSLAETGIRYIWEGKALGGRRRPSKDSRHAALRNPSFRAYADHMASAEFRSGAARLIELGHATQVSVMCAERLPWQCHRFLISDFLVAAGQRVVHLIGEGSSREHRLNPVARLRDGEIVYDGETQPDLKF